MNVASESVFHGFSDVAIGEPAAHSVVDWLVGVHVFCYYYFTIAAIREIQLLKVALTRSSAPGWKKGCWSV